MFDRVKRVDLSSLPHRMETAKTIRSRAALLRTLKEIKKKKPIFSVPNFAAGLGL